MSSDEIQKYQAEEITDLSTAKLSLRWSLEKIRQLDEDVQKLSNRLISKEDEVSRLSKELAHQSTVSLNEKQISSKTNELLEEYKGLMEASMHQLWKKYAPQEAELKKQLEDRITEIGHDLTQVRRMKELDSENLTKAEDNLARVDKERLGLADIVRKKENEIN